MAGVFADRVRGVWSWDVRPRCPHLTDWFPGCPARATGQDDRLDPDLCAELLGFIGPRPTVVARVVQ